jgi:predicted metal-dependent hydrolase
MPNKQFTLDDDLAVTVYKYKSSRHLRLSIAPSGQVRVSIPAWASYRVGLDFAKARQAWIRDQRVTVKPLRPGQAIGKAHHLAFTAKAAATSVSSRLGGTTVVVSHPVAEQFDSPAVQQAAREACVRALRRQAEQLLPQRLANLAMAHGFSYAGVSVKRLKSRWGSCDQHGQIVLNLFLMQLPWELIDYVLLHELTHTRILRHGPPFWKAMAEVLPAAPALKKKLRNYQPILSAADIITA